MPAEVCARKVMVDADFSTAETAEVPLRPIRAGTVQRTGFLLVDPFDFETLMRVVPIMTLRRREPQSHCNTAANNGGSLAVRNGTSLEPGSLRARER